MTRGPIIAIDGPAGAGKSTVARHVAQHFGLLYLETGAMYRAFALKAIVSDQDFDDAASLERLARSTQITLEADRANNRVYLDGQDVTERIRDADVTQSAARPQTALTAAPSRGPCASVTSATAIAPTRLCAPRLTPS
jgi:cytidylate kinase